MTWIWVNPWNFGHGWSRVQVRVCVRYIHILPYPYPQVMGFIVTGHYRSYHTRLLVHGPMGMVFLLNVFILISLNSCHTLMMTLQALVYDPRGASNKQEFIEIWLDHYCELLFFFHSSSCHPTQMPPQGSIPSPAK
jgi:hypothetical protein